MNPIADAEALPGDCSVRSLAFDRLPNGCGSVSTVVIDFSAGSFSSGLFRSQGIDCPEVIARSGRKRQAEFFFGRLAARLALASSGIAPTEIGIGRSREPVWPPGVTGSISHADDIACACICRPEAARAVGIDVERIPPARVLAEIAQLTSSPAERAFLDRWTSAHPGLPPGLPSALLFSVKESVYKALFASVGPGLDFKDVFLTGIDLQRGEIHVASNRTLSPGWPRGQSMGACFERLDEAVVLTCFGWKGG